MRKIDSCCLLVLISLCISGACTTRGTKDQNDSIVANNAVKFSHTEIMDDATFTAQAIDDGLFFVEAAKLAATRAHADDVLQLGQLMLEDHADMNKELRRIAIPLNISFPVKVGTDNARHLGNLSDKNGLAFDEAYTTMMVKRHQAMIDAFTRETEIGSEPSIKKWAADKIIVLQMDLEMSTRAKAAVSRE